MRTFLLTWNPDKWNWDTLDEEIQMLNKIGAVKSSWSCGTNKSIRAGDRLFLIRLGQTPKGIIGSGFASSNVFEDSHWSGEIGRIAKYIELDFDILLNPEKEEILNIEILKSEFPTQQWSTQNSGISIKKDIAIQLEEKWFNFINNKQKFKNEYIETPEYSINTTTEFIEGNASQIIITKYERNPYARRKCIEHYGTSCVICNFNFSKMYGEVGEGFIHVHHLTSIAEIGEKYILNPINDLRPVCANCHSIIHKRKPSYTIEEMKKIIEKNRFI